MIEIIGARLSDAAGFAAATAQLLTTHDQMGGGDFDFDANAVLDIRYRIAIIRQATTEMQLAAVTFKVDRLEKNLKGALIEIRPNEKWRLPKHYVPQLAKLFEEVGSGVRDELFTRTALLLDPSDMELFKPSEPLLSEPVCRTFPDAIDDIDEAGKCLALGLATACVFHLMRAAECAAAVVVKSFDGETHKENGEQKTFGGLNVEVRKKVTSMRQGPEQDAWNKLSAMMSGMNRGDRTKVAHPGRFYSEPQARSLFAQTKSFMEEAEELIRA